MVMCLAACGSSDSSSETDTEAAVVSDSTTAEEVTEEETTAAPEPTDDGYWVHTLKIVLIDWNWLIFPDSEWLFSPDSEWSISPDPKKHFSRFAAGSMIGILTNSGSTGSITMGLFFIENLSGDKRRRFNLILKITR